MIEAGIGGSGAAGLSGGADVSGVGYVYGGGSFVGCANFDRKGPPLMIVPGDEIAPAHSQHGSYRADL